LSYFLGQWVNGTYTWDLSGYSLAEFERLNPGAWEAQDGIVETPKFTLTRTVSPEVLADKTTLQKVTVVFRLEEPLPDEIQLIQISIGDAINIFQERPLVEVQRVDQNEVDGWELRYNPFCAFWRAEVPLLPEVGKTYKFEATIKSTKSDRILGSPIYKPRVNVDYSFSKHPETVIGNSVTLVYSSAISATFGADNIVVWKSPTILVLHYCASLEPVLLGTVGDNPPFHVKVDADITIKPETLDLANEGIFTAFIKLPEGYDVNDIDLNTVYCEGALAIRGLISESDTDTYIVEFSIHDLVYLPVGNAVMLTVTGELADGTLFEGSTTVFLNPPLIRDQKIFELTILCPTEYAFRMEYAQMIADEFSKVGINVVVDYVNINECAERCFASKGRLYKNGGFDVAVFDWAFGEIDHEVLYFLFHSDNSTAKDSMGGNTMSWENEESDVLIDKMRTETDETKLKECWLQWQELFYEEQPILPILHFYREKEGQKQWAFSQLSLNFNHPILKKKAVRQALSHLIPRQKICNLYNIDEKHQRSGTLTPAEPCAVPVNPDSWAFNKNLEPYSYDPELAEELLFKAGYKIKTKKHEDAESLLNQAEKAFGNFEFQNALFYGIQAEQLYEELEDEENKSLIGNILLKYQTAVDAERLFEQGEEAFEEEDYETALNLFQQAREMYTGVGSEKATECDQWNEKIQAAKNKRNVIAIAIVVIAILAIVLILINRCRSKGTENTVLLEAEEN
jgi:tetratricopeptide (TPR) repeat protein